MAIFSTISEKQAPARPVVRSNAVKARMRMYDEFVASLTKKEVGEVSPEAAETPRSLVTRLTRAATRQGLTATTWNVNGKAYIRVER
jgi:hypothetical protein